MLIYLRVDPLDVISLTSIVLGFDSRLFQILIFITKFVIYFLIGVDIARNMSYLIHYQLIILTKYANILSMLGKIPKKVRNFGAFIEKWQHFFIVSQNLGGVNDNAIFLIMWHALVLEVVLLFVSIWLYRHVPLMIYQLVVTTAINIATIMKIFIPFFANLGDKSTLLLHEWRGVPHNSRHLQKKFRSLRPIVFKVACDDVVLFVMEKSLKTSYFNAILNFVITALLA